MLKLIRKKVFKKSSNIAIRRKIKFQPGNKLHSKIEEYFKEKSFILYLRVNKINLNKQISPTNESCAVPPEYTNFYWYFRLFIVIYYVFIRFVIVFFYLTVSIYSLYIWCVVSWSLECEEGINLARNVCIFVWIYVTFNVFVWLINIYFYF